MEQHHHDIGIIGLGLIGCSLALGLRKSGFAGRITGMDANAEHEREALGAGLIDAVGDMKQVCGAEIIIVATPVDISAGIIKQALDMSGENAAVIDVGSTKNRVMQNAGEHPEHRRFIPTHPMAGTENSGPLAAVEGLFRNRTVILLPYPDGDKDKTALIEAMYRSLGSEIVFMDPIKHDMSVAYVSHISHISSYALALTVLNKERDEENITRLAAGGFDSTARLAKSSASMWEPIFLENRTAIIDVLDEYIENIILFKHAIKSGNGQVIRTLIGQANKVREVLDKDKKNKEK